MSNSTDTNWDYIVYASGFYLTERLPRESSHWEDDKLDTFVEEHVWEPFEYYNASQIWDFITTLSFSLEKDFILRKKFGGTDDE
jgi:hypothetical protein